MTHIVGNVILIENDVATVDGTPVVGTVTSIKGSDAGNNTITINNSTIAPTGVPLLDAISASGGGNDVITITDSVIAGEIELGASTIDGTTSNGGHTLIIKDSQFQTVQGLSGTLADPHTIYLDGATQVSDGVNSSLGSRDDVLNIVDSTFGPWRLGGGNDTVNIINSGPAGNARLRGMGGDDSLNLPVGTVVTDGVNGTFTVQLGVSYSLSSGTAVLPTGQTVRYQQFENGIGIDGVTPPPICFCKDTLIATPHGETLVQDLSAGDDILTADGQRHTIRWVGSRTLHQPDFDYNEHLRPVRITAGALGQNLPKRDLLVSRQHRILVSSFTAERVTGDKETLVAAIKLTKLPGIYVDNSDVPVTYYHILLDTHEILLAEGAPSESLYLGEGAINTMSKAARREIQEIFPGLMHAQGLHDTMQPICPNTLLTDLIAEFIVFGEDVLSTFRQDAP
ncbi:MAG: Hint domain-containing protein [Halocynthiibacter sp.]